MTRMTHHFASHEEHMAWLNSDAAPGPFEYYSATLAVEYPSDGRVTVSYEPVLDIPEGVPLGWLPVYPPDDTGHLEGALGRARERLKGRSLDHALGAMRRR